MAEDSSHADLVFFFCSEYFSNIELLYLKVGVGHELLQDFRHNVHPFSVILNANVIPVKCLE